MSISQCAITLTSVDGSQCACYLAIAAGNAGPGLLLLHDQHGLTDHIKHVANLYAEEGWVVAVPDLYWALGDHCTFGFDPDAVAQASAASARFDLAQGVATAQAAMMALRARPECSGRAGVVGYGLGGTLALKFAGTQSALGCAVVYYPTLLERVADSAASITCRTLLHATTAAAPAAEEALLARFDANSVIEIQRYATAAGFDNANLLAFDRSTYWLAKSRTLAVLRASLGPVYDIERLWEAHLYSEFADRNVEVSMATMVDEPYVLVVPTVTGGTGKAKLHRWYSNHFHFQNPPDTRVIPISRTVGTDRLVDEFIFCFTHDRVMDWILPNIAPTGKYVEVPMTAVVNFRGPKLYHEHIAWDQATVLVQTGLLDPVGLPVTGIEQARAMQDEQLPRNRLIPGWQEA